MTLPAPEASNILAAVVVHHPDDRLARVVEALLPQVSRVLLIDNGSPAEVLVKLSAWRDKHPQITLFPLGENRGVAAALNLAAKEARRIGAAWLLTMDQDSIPTPDMVARLGEVFARCEDVDRLGLIAGNYRTRRGTPGYPVATGAPFATPTVAITSGSLVRVDACEKIGGFREDYFIDEVDHDFCLRLRAAGFLVRATAQIVLDHRLGGDGAPPGASPVTVSHHSATRRYYMTRNVLTLARRHFFTAPGWVSLRLLQVAVYAALSVTVEDDRRRKLRMIVRGAFDAARGKMGPLTD